MIQLINRIRRMRKKWSGNILCMSDNKMVKQVFRCEPRAGDHEEGQRSGGWTVLKST